MKRLKNSANILFGGIIAGGMLILAMTLLIAVPISADDLNNATTQPPQGVEPEQPAYNEVKEVIHNPPVWRTYKDFNAWWGENRDHATLLDLEKVQGSDYFIHPMSVLQVGIPSGTAVVLMTSNSYGWTSTRDAQKHPVAQANLTSFLQGGGVVIVDMGDNDYYDGYRAPGAVGTPSYIFSDHCTDATLNPAAVAANHPIIIGPDGIPGTADDLNNSNIDMSYSCWVAHGNLVDGITLPPDATVIMTATFGGVEKPILAEYCYQGGRVIVDTVTKEFVAHQPSGYGYTNLMRNLFSYALSPQARCAPVNQPPSISSLNQYKSDGQTEIPEGGITAESSPNNPLNSIIVFKVTSTDPDGDQVKLQVELKEFNRPFNEQNLLESGYFPSGSEITITRDFLVEGKYKWRARAVDKKEAASDWQEFGEIGNVDFEVKLVPLYTQVESPYPSLEETRKWFDKSYADATSGEPYSSCGWRIMDCGCAITSMVMLGRYYDINMAIDNSDVDPGNINNWLTDNKGYTRDGRLYWGKGIEYFGFIDEITGKKMARLNLDYYNEPSTSYRIDDYLNFAKPTVTYSSTHGHYFVIDGKIKKDRIDTYTLKDPAWYNTKTLNDPKNLANKVQSYGNYFSKANLFSYLEVPKRITASMYLYLASPAELLVTDPQGRKLGKDPIDNIIYNEIPDSSYTQEGSIITSETPLSELPEAKVIYIPTPIDGKYDIRVIGTETGSYIMGLLAYDKTGQSKDITQEGTTATNNIQEFELDYSTQTAQDLEIYRIVNIDIKPGSYPNSINLKSKGVIPVAILTDEFFDAKNVVVNSIVFAVASPLRGNLEDVDSDGDLDLILHFTTQSLQLNSTDNEAVLTGQLKDGSLIKGTDSVRIVK